MKIEPIVAKIAKRFGADPALVQAVIEAEGGGDAILKAVRCSIPSCKDRDEAIEITCRSANHALSAYISANDAPGFVAFWGSKWAPEGVRNDPNNLNRNWPSNVLSLWKGVKA